MRYRFVKSAGRVFELLELLDAEQRPLKVAEIVEKLDIPQSSASMLVKTLASRGYLLLDPVRREYSPSLRIAFLADWVTHSPEHHAPIRETMQGLASETGETVILARRSGLLVQYVSVVQSEQNLRFSVRSGSVRPLHRTATGIVLLSEFNDDQVSRLLRRLKTEDRTQDVNIAETMRAISLARQNGFYESAGLMTPGAGVIAVLIPTRLRGELLAIGVGGPVERLRSNREAVLAAILRAVKV